MASAQTAWRRLHGSRSTPGSSVLGRRWVSSVLRKERFDRPAAIVEDRLELPPHEEGVDDPADGAEGEAILDAVPHPDPVPVGLETVCVDPAPVWPPLLHVLELGFRPPEGDAGDPSQREEGPADAVLDPATLAKPPRRARDAQTKPGRRDPTEVSRVGEEGEDLRERSGDALGPIERVQDGLEV